MASEQLLSVLADGEFHSGEELGGLLGVSRAAVWKQLQKLEELSLSIEAQKGRGYRVVGGLDLLNRELIAQHADQA
ncbi:HTH domain-containing protein, partial [Spongiibacter tropicus]